MRIFGEPQARHYSSGFAPPVSSGSFRTYGRTLATGRLSEGTVAFDTYRATALQDAERSVYFAGSHYRRAIDLLMASSAGWAAVTCYYGSFHAARAILHMFGSAVLGNKVVFVDRAQPGSQRLRVAAVTSLNLSTNGSHREFWELFYRAATNLQPLVDPTVRFALQPITNPSLPDQRNDINYDSFSNLGLASAFAQQFTPQTFPSSLPGVLATQYRVSKLCC